MDDEVLNVLKEIRDLHKEGIENHKKTIEFVKTQQKSYLKKVFIMLAVFLVLVFIFNLIK